MEQALPKTEERIALNPITMRAIEPRAGRGAPQVARY